MVTKTASEIVQAARYLAGVRNSNMSDFFNDTNVLNNLYKDAYRKIVAANSLYIKTVEDIGTEYQLPEDCFGVMQVYYKVNSTEVEIPRAPARQQVSGTYKLSNNTIKVFGNFSNICIRYSILPDTLTAPDKPIVVGLPESAEIKQLCNDVIYYESDGAIHGYNVSTEETLECDSIPHKATQTTFMGKEFAFDNGTITLDGEDTTETFKVIDSDISSAVVDDPYMMVSFANGDTYLFTGYNFTYWNIEAPTGHKTLARVLGMDTNDGTGKGVVYIDLNDGQCKYGSFVPDTVVTSPSNILFTFLETKLAAYLLSITGGTNDYLLGELLPRAEQEFADSLNTDQASAYRMRNSTTYNYIG